MTPSRRLPLLLALSCVVFPCRPTYAGAAIARDAVASNPRTVNTVTLPFSAYRVGSPYATRAFRDLEFFWDPMNDSTITSNVQTTLNNFAHVLVDSTGRNPLKAPYADFQLIYDYFRSSRYGASYDSAATDTLAVWFGHDTGSYNPSDRSHADVYLFNPARSDTAGEYPSIFISNNEDVSTGHSLGDVLHSNSLMFRIPTGSSRIDSNWTGWTKPNASWNTGFDHEFRHGLPGTLSGDILGEMFSAGAEAIGGNDARLTIGDPDAPYTWPLFSGPSGGPSCTDVTSSSWNYQGRSEFASYLAYNFRGIDTTTTLAGFQDDLLHKWATDSSATVTRFARLLRDDSCKTCSLKTYFHPNATALNDTLRLGLLHHNWRVANYVNNSFLAEGQYGYPPQFDYAPWKQQGAWQDLDGCTFDNVIAVPSEVTLGTSPMRRDTVLREVRTGGTGNYPMVLAPYGSEYWIVRSDASIQQSGQALTIRILVDSTNVLYQESYCDDLTHGGTPAWHDARLFASAIGYSQESDSLWKHPEWVVNVSEPQYVSVDSLGADVVQMVVPSFGDTVKAVLVVLSLADGPHPSFLADANHGLQFSEWLTYRMQLGLRTSPYADPNPAAIATDPSILEEEPTISPDGTMVAYTEQGASGPSQIYLRGVDGSGRTQMHSNSVGHQNHPDWSPRGDRIAYEDFEAGWAYSEIHLFNPNTSAHSIMPTYDGVDLEPAFSPNGQRVAYVCHLLDYHGDADSNWVLRRIDVSGSNITTLVRSSTSRQLHSPRWDPSGRLIYFLSGDSLYSVGVDGGAQGVVSFLGSLLNHVSSIDLHRGRGPIAIEEADSASILRSCVVWPTFQFVDGRFKKYPYRRVALRDTLQRFALPQFQQRGVKDYSPRWSYDGTRIVYSTDQANPGTARDLYIGQVTGNHAPLFVNAPRDTTIPSTCSFTATFTATDADGDPLVFTGEYLPLGATISSSGDFAWVNPGKYTGDNYLVFRVLDDRGGVAQKVVKYTVPADTVRPAAATDVVTSMGKTSAAIIWTNVGDDSLTGDACGVVVRYSTSAFTEGNFFTNGSEVPDVDAPGAPGTQQCALVPTGYLTACNWYYFAMKTVDDAGNWSALSNVVNSKTRCSGSTQAFCGGFGGLRASTDDEVVSFALYKAEPTPFSSSTRIRFDLPAPAWASLEIFDLGGRRVATLANELLPGGRYSREWRGVGSAGQRLAPGVYLYRLRAGQNSARKKLILLP